MMTDKPALMSRKAIEECRKMTMQEVLIHPEIAHGLCDSALAAHDIYAQAYDKAIEDAAQLIEIQEWGDEPKDLANDIRQLKGTSNG